MNILAIWLIAKILLLVLGIVGALIVIAAIALLILAGNNDFWR